jgi:hypothetical protein
MREIFWLAEKLLGFQEGLCAMEFVKMFLSISSEVLCVVPESGKARTKEKTEYITRIKNMVIHCKKQI